MIYSLKKLNKKQEAARKTSERRGFHVIMNWAYEQQPIPIVGRQYYAYDDGKIRISREYAVTVQKIFDYTQLPAEIKKVWQEEVISCYWLYAPDSDCFVYAMDDKYEYWFCRTKDGGWFGFNQTWGNGQLDVTGELYKIAHGED